MSSRNSSDHEAQAWRDIKNAGDSAAQNVKEGAQEGARETSGFFSNVYNSVKRVFQGGSIQDPLPAKANPYGNGAQNLKQDMQEGAARVLGGAKQQGESEAERARKKVKEGRNDVQREVEDKGQKFKDTAREKVHSVDDKAREVKRNVESKVREEADHVRDKVGDIKGRIARRYSEALTGRDRETGELPKDQAAAAVGLDMLAIQAPEHFHPEKVTFVPWKSRSEKMV